MTETNEKSLPVKTNSDQNPTPVHSPTLAEHVEAIRALRKRATADIIEIGRRLTEANTLAGHGHWLRWLEREFGWTDKTAENFMSIFKASGKFENFSNIDLPISSLYLLAAPNTPPKAVETVIDRVKTGVKVTGAEVKKIVRATKPRTSDTVTKKVPAAGAEKRGEEAKRHDERMKSARIKLEAFIRDYHDMAEWKGFIETIKKQLTAL